MDTKKTNAFASNFWIKLTANKKLFIVSCIVNLLGIPLFVFAKVLNVKADSISSNSIDDLDYSCYYFISIASMFVLLAIVVISAFSIFNYLYSKPMVDVIYSLPITVNQRFFSDYLAGLAVTGIPYIASMIISLIINGISFAAVPAWASSQVQGDTGSTAVVFQGYLYVFLLMLMLYTITVLVLTFCGSIIEGIGYTVILNAVVPIVMFVLFAFMSECVYGMSTPFPEFDIFRYAVSLGGLIVSAEFVGSVMELSSFDSVNLAHCALWAVIYFLITAVIFGISYLFYRKRKAEDVTKPFVFKAVYYVIMTCICFCMSAAVVIFSIMSSSECVRISSGIPWIIAGAVLFFILDTIQNRGFKKFGSGVIKYIAMTGGSVLLLMIMVWTDGFGSTYKIPDIDDIESVDIYGSSMLGGGRTININIKTPENIETVIEVHKDAVNDYKEFVASKPNAAKRISYSPDEASQEYFEVIYNLKSGRTLKREYDIDCNSSYKINSLYLEESNIDAIIKNLRYNYSDEVYKDKEYVNPDISDKLGNYINISLGRDKISNLISVYEKDLRSADIDNVMNEAETYCFFDGYAVLTSYKNTVDYLKEIGIKITESDIVNSITDLITDNRADIFMDSSVVAEYAGTDFIAPFVICPPYNNPDDSFYNVTLDYRNKRAFAEMFVHAEPCYVTKNLNAVQILFNGNRYILPEKYRNYAENFIKSLDESEYVIYNQEYYNKNKDIYDYDYDYDYYYLR